jgi:hypothetical protein
MRIGLDLDGVVFYDPEFFACFLAAMTSAGHTVFCTSNWGRRDWPKLAERLRGVGVPPDLFDLSLMAKRQHLLGGKLDGYANKQRMWNKVDVVFDDDAEKILKRIPKPRAAVFTYPYKTWRRKVDRNGGSATEQV